MANVATIRAAIRTRMQTVTGLNTYDTVPSQPVVPCAFVVPATGSFLDEVTFGGAEDLSLVVTVLVQKVVDGVAQGAVDAYLSESLNIADAIDAGKTSDWDFVQTGAARAWGQYVFGDGEGAMRYLGYEIPVMVAVP